MSLIFYFAPNSTSGVTTNVLAELEYGLPNPLAQRVKVLPQNGDTSTSEYLSTVNPNGKVPAIIHEGTPIWESAAITIYLGETFGTREGKPSLYPPPGPQRGEAMKWIIWTHTTLLPLVRTLMVASREKNGNTEAKAEAAETVEILDGALKGRDYLLGDVYCLADTHVWTMVSFLAFWGLNLEPHSRVQDWASRIGARPALTGLPP